jgi:hypothetical protein
VPEWSSDATYPAGSDPWSATDTKIEPTTGEVEAGATPKTGFGAQQFNWLLNNHASALIWLMKAVTGQAILVQDEFTGDPGDTVPDTIWEATNAAAGVLPAYIDDSAAGASGSAAFVLSNAGSSRLNAKIVVGTSDFYVRCRVRRATSTGSAEVITVGCVEWPIRSASTRICATMLARSGARPPCSKSAVEKSIKSCAE